ncbi:Flp1 family type IVb pilin [Paenibacillus sp. GCM10012307]|uniref:Multidrug transporter n=1 Tax=Paenibacillus roseus TaxID=2798579 RepID=A0A934IY67_9BACL|nr:Flp1 family type IVb pilin [Paenibacillus roseus]MBJ6361426.1 multidrug transporter [Paenibacillus roseus]
MWTKVKDFGGKLWRSEDGMGTLEVILIIAVLILVALLFKKQILALVENLMGKADTKANTIFDTK